MTDPSRLIADVRGLVTAILEANVGKNKLATKLSKDKATISRWQDGSSLPTDPRDVAWLIRVALDALAGRHHLRNSLPGRHRRSGPARNSPRPGVRRRHRAEGAVQRGG